MSAIDVILIIFDERLTYTQIIAVGKFESLAAVGLEPTTYGL